MNEIEWAGGKHVFNLNTPDVRAVLAGRGRKMARTTTGAFDFQTLHGQYGDTPAACLKRFEEGVYSIADVELVILYALWGGGMKFSEADALVEQHVRTQPIAGNAVTAYTVLSTLFVGAAT